jgi:hypothetical protein
MNTLLNKSLLLDNNKDTNSSRLFPSNLPDHTNDKALLSLDGLQTLDPAYSIAKGFKTENGLVMDNEILSDESFQALGLVEVKDYAELARKALIPQGETIDPPETVFQLMGVSIFTKKSFSVISAKPKAGKTTTAAWIIARAMKDQIKVVWIDTEQGRPYAGRTQSWILEIAELASSEYLRYYDIKLHGPEDRIKLIDELMLTEKPQILVIDGIRDLLYDINSPTESTSISTKLMQWADIGNCHILTIIHQNKSNDEARGHIGTELMNKAETVIKISRGKTEEIIVEHAYARGISFAPFVLIRSEDGIPHLAKEWKLQVKSTAKRALKPEDIERDLHIEVVKEVFISQLHYRYGNLVEKIAAILELKKIKIGDNKIKDFLTYYQDQEMVIKNPNIKGTAKYESGLT